MRSFLSRTGRFVATLAFAMVAIAVFTPPLAAHVLGIVASHATPSISTFANALAVHALALGGGAKLAMFGPLLGLKPKTQDQLKADATAVSPEFYPQVWFDSATFTSASTSGVLNFFSNTNADPTLSNMQLAGAFPADETFQIGEIHFDVLERSTAETAGAADTAATGAMDDLQQLVYTSRAQIAFLYNNKTYGPLPLAVCRPLGFVRGATAGTFAAATAVQFAGWDAVGLIYEKQITISAQKKFGVSITWPSQVTLSQASVVVRVGLRGVHYRPVA